MRIIKHSFIILALSWGLISCSQSLRTDSTFLTPADIQYQTLSTKSILLNASSPALKLKKGWVITDNDRAFKEKIKLIRQARNTIDLAYYIYQDDYSSSVFSKALIDAANRGVRVRLLLDYQSTYNNLDLFSMLEHYGNQGGNQGKGSLEVRFYNRPTLNIIKDAVFLTLGCGDIVSQKNLKACSSAKYKEIESRFLSTRSNDLSGLNYNSGRSGLFLSAFYANNIELMALAIRDGQGLDQQLTPKSDSANTSSLDAATLDKLISLAKTYIQARHGNGIQQFAANLKLKLAFAFFGGEINPYYDALTAYFPIGRDQPRLASLKDWDYVKDFYHQKLLLVDESKLLLGGRNIEDAYHMHPNTLTGHNVFLDTDVLLELQAKENSLEKAFERLWGFRQMVADIADIRLHAPNDFLVASVKTKEACGKLMGQQQSRCEKNTFKKHLDLQYRIQIAYQIMLKNSASYHQHYVARQEPNRPQFSIDAEAEIYYIENLPFLKPTDPVKQVPKQAKQKLIRQYGAANGKEGRSGKYIHNLWLAALRNTCKQATTENPQEIIVHNAYVFFPSNLLQQLAEMATGAQDCRHVSITVLTNSIHTTDLGIENYAARYSMKAFSHYVLNHKNKEKAAKFAFYEYMPTKKQHNKPRSLHSKVMIFGSDIFIGSANADVRSYMMDANNGLYIRQAPKLLNEYAQWFHTILSDSQRTKNITHDFVEQALQESLAEDVPKLQSILLSFGNKLPGQSSLNPAIQSQLGEQLKAALESIYRLSLKSLEGNRDSEKAQDHFNRLFKMI